MVSIWSELDRIRNPEDVFFIAFTEPDRENPLMKSFSKALLWLHEEKRNTRGRELCISSAFKSPVSLFCLILINRLASGYRFAVNLSRLCCDNS